MIVVSLQENHLYTFPTVCVGKPSLSSPFSHSLLLCSECTFILPVYFHANSPSVLFYLKHTLFHVQRLWSCTCSAFQYMWILFSVILRKPSQPVAPFNLFSSFSVSVFCNSCSPHDRFLHWLLLLSVFILSHCLCIQQLQPSGQNQFKCFQIAPLCKSGKFKCGCWRFMRCGGIAAHTPRLQLEKQKWDSIFICYTASVKHCSDRDFLKPAAFNLWCFHLK